MKDLLSRVAFSALTLGALAQPAAAQIAGDRSFQSSVPYYRDLKPWDPNYKPPRTPDGRPDLQGVWSNAALTMMTRRGGIAGGAGTDLLVIPESQVAELTFNHYGSMRMRVDNERTDPSTGAGDGVGGGNVRGYNNFWLDHGSEFSKVNGEYRSSWIVKPEDGMVPFSSKGRQAQAARMSAVRNIRNTGPEIRTLADRCLLSFASQAGPPLNNATYNNNYQIVQTPDHFMINTEMVHDVRIVPLDKRVGAAVIAATQSTRPWFGGSTGRWEGDTLVIESRNFHPLQETGGSFPLSTEAKVTERFTRKSDVEIFYEFTVEDAVNYTMPWSGEMTLVRSTEPLYEYACHEGNYSLPGMLYGDSIGLDTAIEAEGE